MKVATASASLSLRHIWFHPLSNQRMRVTRIVVRAAASLASRYVIEIRGLENISPEMDPFIFVSNHNQRLEALMVPALLIHRRDGKLIHFMADWPTMMVPLAGLALRAGQVIPVTTKRAKVGFLNRLKGRYKTEKPAFEIALDKLSSGASVGIFPEGTMNRDPKRLLRGQTGAARMALRAGVPVVPAGITFPGHDPEEQIRDRTPMVIEIGEAIQPPAWHGTGSDKPDRETIRGFHARLMGEISRLSGKQWHPKARRRKHVPERSDPERSSDRPQS